MTEERFSIIDYPALPMPQKIKILYHVRADSEYRVKRWSYNSVDFIAVLTESGSGKIRTHEQEFLLKKGDFIVLGADQLKDYNVDGEEWNFLWFEFESDSLPVEPFTVYSMPEEEWREDECEECLKYMQQNRGEIASAVFTSLLYKWADVVDVLKQDDDYTLVNRSVRYIREHLKTISVKEIAEAFFLSDRTLRNVYERYLGMSPSEVIRKIRLKEAKNLLESSGTPMSEISDRLGYDNPNYFSKVFTKYVGISPMQYRNRAITFRISMNFPEAVAEEKTSLI